MKGFTDHPYIPNSNSQTQLEMLSEIGLSSLEELHAEIPEDLRLKKELNLPRPYLSEFELSREVSQTLNKNSSTQEYLSFLGAGCWPHYVPAVCDEINSRSEFLTAYAGEPYNDHGRFQALFEYESLMAELLNTEVVSVPTFDWGQAAATSVRMASRYTSRKRVLIAGTIAPDRFMIMQNYCDPDIELVKIPFDHENGLMNLDELRNLMTDQIAAVYFENPSYLGFIETQGETISKIAKDFGALTVVGVDPISLGVLSPPMDYGADIVCGDLQPLGNHMNYGGSQSGFISTMNDESIVMEYPSRLFGIAPTLKSDEYGFGDVAYDRTSFGDLRENAKEYVGTQTALIGITAGVYLSLIGPNGMFELGQNIIQKTQYAINQLSQLKDVIPSKFGSNNFKEFVVDFNKLNLSVKEINQRLLEKGIIGGKDLSDEFPDLGQSALFCVTEIHLKDDIDRLVTSLKEILSA